MAPQRARRLLVPAGLRRRNRSSRPGTRIHHRLGRKHPPKRPQPRQRYGALHRLLARHPRERPALRRRRVIPTPKTPSPQRGRRRWGVRRRRRFRRRRLGDRGCRRRRLRRWGCGAPGPTLKAMEVHGIALLSDKLQEAPMNILFICICSQNMPTGPTSSSSWSRSTASAASAPNSATSASSSSASPTTTSTWTPASSASSSSASHPTAA